MENVRYTFRLSQINTNIHNDTFLIKLFFFKFSLFKIFRLPFYAFQNIL